MGFLSIPCVGSKGTPCRFGGKNGVVQTNSGPMPCPGCDGTGRDPGIPEFSVYHQTYTLNANQVQTNMRIILNGDAAFEILLMAAVSTGTFRVKLYDNEGKARVSNGDASGGGSTNDRVPASLLFGTGSLPFVVVPGIIIPKAGTIGFDLEDTSGAGNTVTLSFSGNKLYPTAE